MEKNRVLIIKTGYSEFLDNSQDSTKVSFGDILRTTPLLHVYKEDEVTWITDKRAFPLLEGSALIDRLLPLDFSSAMHLLEEEFDTLINLEKNHDICKFSNKINAWRKFGFRFDKKTGRPEAYDRASEVLTVSFDPNVKKQNKKTVQELLFEMVGNKWNGEEYVIGYKPETKEEFDIALNTEVGPKWPTKAWQKENWDIVENLLIRDGFKVTRQDKQDPKILNNLYSYMDWINSSKLIISSDTLGIHLGIAFKKKTLGLFGPTPHKEVHLYGRGKLILPEPLPDCLPCFNSECERMKNCINDISPERVYEEVKTLLNS